nr:GreA/GreB family elongation factor [Variovorax boronicumulans]
MQSVNDGERTLTDLDYARLLKLAQRGHAPCAAWLADAEVIRPQAAPADLVTMGSRVELVDLRTRQRQMLTLCYPGEAAPAEGCISVLSPVGSSLLGLRVGDVATWHVPGGAQHAVEITGVHDQPEAAGDFTR